MAKISVQFNETGTITVVLKDTSHDGKRVVRTEIASNLADLARAVGALFPPTTP